MRFEFALSEDELVKELQNLEDYWPLSVEDLPVGRAYPSIAALSKDCTVIVGESASGKVH